MISTSWCFSALTVRHSSISLPAGGHDLHIGDGDSSRLAAGCYCHALALRKPALDKIVKHLRFEAVVEHKRFHGGAVGIEGEQLERPVLILRQVFSRVPRHNGTPSTAPSFLW